MRSAALSLSHCLSCTFSLSLCPSPRSVCAHGRRSTLQKCSQTSLAAAGELHVGWESCWGSFRSEAASASESASASDSTRDEDGRRRTCCHRGPGWCSAGPHPPHCPASPTRTARSLTAPRSGKRDSQAVSASGQAARASAHAAGRKLQVLCHHIDKTHTTFRTCITPPCLAQRHVLHCRDAKRHQAFQAVLSPPCALCCCC